MIQVKRGAINVLTEIMIYNSMTGQPLSGLSASSTGIQAAYRARGNAGAYTLFSLTGTGTLGTWASGWFKEIDPPNAPGKYELGLPNVFTGMGQQGDYVDFYLNGAANMSAVPLHVDIVAFDPQDSVHLGLSALPAQAAGAAGGLALGDGAGNALLSGATESAIASLVAGAVLASPSHPLNNDAAGNVGLAAAYLPTLTAAVAAAILATPSNKLATDSNGLVGANNTATAAAVAASVLDAALAGHTGAGTAGAALNTLVGALAESYAVNGQPGTMAQLLYGILAILMNVSQSGTTLTAAKLDGTTPAMSFTLDSATAPTSRKRAA